MKTSKRFAALGNLDVNLGINRVSKALESMLKFQTRGV
jgi:hypothetical protein